MKISKFAWLASFAFIGLCGCSRNESTSCDSLKSRNQLLELAKQTASGVNFLSESIGNTQTKPAEQTQKTLTCAATIHFSHSVFPQQNFFSNYRYQVSPNGTLSSFNYASGRDEVNFLQWFYSLPNIVGFQRSRFGVLAVLQLPQSANGKNTQNQIQQLSLNNRLIQLAKDKNYSTITIDKKYSLATSEVYLISAYFNAAKDDNSNHNYLISIESNSQYNITPAFSLQDGSIQKANNSLTFNGLPAYTYSESTDFPQYQYLNQQLRTLRSSLPDSYYHNKFARLSSSQILQQIKADGCLNGDQFYSSDICSAHVSAYCFKFSSISPKKKDKAYWLLKQMCKNPAME